jgi:FKBP-type peptidyl-prolyl cis-trans isomerase FklB
MNKYIPALLMVGFLGCQTTGEKPVKLESKEDKVSYSIGMNIGSSLKRDSITIVPEAFLRGIADAKADSAQRLMTDQEVQETLSTFQEEMRTRKADNAKAQSEKNRIDGEAFLAENGKKEGVVTRPSGLQYKVLNEGKGKSPKETSTVTVNYVGRLLDGTEFDSSFKRGEPATFPLGGMIRGWIEGVPLMKEGAKYEFYIPPSLGWGENGAGGVIPPNATVIFQVELISFK